MLINMAVFSSESYYFSSRGEMGLKIAWLKKNLRRLQAIWLENI